MFLSYARDERFPGGSGFVARLVDELRREGFAPWIDLASIPQPGRSVRFEPELLRQLLKDGLRQASLMVALTGPLYRERDWTCVEWDLAMLRSHEGPLGVLQVRIDGEVMDPEVDAIERGSPTVTAKRIRNWWNATTPERLSRAP